MSAKRTVSAAEELTAAALPTSRKALLSAAADDEAVGYSSDDAMLYALGLGFASDPRNVRELDYVYRQPLLKTVPTLATMLLDDAFPSEEYGWNAARSIVVEQKLELFRPLPESASLLANRRVIDVSEHHDGTAARIVVHSDVRFAADDSALFTLAGTLIAADGLDAWRHEPSALLARQRSPRREPDLRCDIRTRPDQALLFCLSGDHNPLYADPATARAAGFDSSLLQGRCLLGIGCRAILRTICDYDYTLIRGVEARLTAPVFPGDVVTTDMWQDRNIVSFRSSVRARRTVVLDGGRCVLAG